MFQGKEVCSCGNPIFLDGLCEYCYEEKIGGDTKQKIHHKKPLHTETNERPDTTRDADRLLL